MKKLFATIALAAMIPAGLAAQKADFAKEQEMQFKKPVKEASAVYPVPATLKDKKEVVQVTGQNDSLITTIRLYKADWNFTNHNGFQYEPHTDKYLWGFRDYQATPLEYSLKVYFFDEHYDSQFDMDNFENAAHAKVAKSDVYGFGFLNYYVVNPTQSSDVNDLCFGGIAQKADYDEGRYVSPVLFFKAGTEDPEFIDDAGADANTTWGLSFNATSHIKDGNGYIDLFGKSSLWYKDNLSTHYNFYSAVFESDLESYENLGAVSDDQFKKTNFFMPDPNATGSYLSDGAVDADANGNVYVASLNWFNDLGTDYRLPMVRKSTDNGESFGDWEALPYSVIEAFVIQKGTDYMGFYSHYEGFGFAVTGEDEFSFLIRAYFDEDTEDQENPLDFALLQVYKAAGQWGIREVSDWSGAEPMVLQREYDGETQSYLDADLYLNNDRGNELQLSKTADGKYLIAKWVDMNADSVVTLATPYNVKVLNQNQELEAATITEYNHCELFLSYIDLDNVQDGWKDKKKSGYDPVSLNYSHNTYIPKIVKNIKQVRVMEANSETLINAYTDEENSYYDNQESDYAYRKGADVFTIVAANDIYKRMMFWDFDLDGIISVEEEEALNFSVNDIYPNPAQDVAHIAYTLNTAANVTVEIYDALGNIVFTDNSQRGLGAHALTVNLDNFSTGSYYYSVIANGQRITKVLNVVK